MLGLCKEGSWVSRPPPPSPTGPRPAVAESTTIPAHQSWALVQSIPLSSRPVVAGAGDHTVPVTHSPQGASLLVGKGRGPRETGAGMAGCTGRGRGMGNKEFKLGLPN